MVACVSHTTVVPLGQVLLLTYGQVVAAMCIVLVLCIEFDCSLSHLGGWFTSDISQQLDLRDRYAARSDDASQAFLFKFTDEVQLIS